MRASIAILLFIVCCYSSPLKEEDYQSLFTKWAVTNGKNYELDTFFKRYSIFKQNIDYINDHNAKNSSFELAMNNFGDLTFEEFSAAYTGLLNISTENTSEIFDEDPPSQTDEGSGGSLDWRNKGAVNGIQSQGGCGSCYAFSAVASIEGAWAVKKGKLFKLSEQQVVDCSRAQGNGGCGGGCTGCVFTYCMKYGLTTKSNYPYTGKDGTCQASKYSPAVKISSWKTLSPKNEGAMMTAIKSQPLSVAIAASKPFQFYSTGVLDDSSCGASTLNHAVNVVGYGTASGKDYWIIRNSWGTGYGEKGYIRMVRNKNMCGLAQVPNFPIV